MTNATPEVSKTLFWHSTGPLIAVGGGMLITESLNPQNRIAWRMSRKELARLGWRMIIAAIRGFG